MSEPRRMTEMDDLDALLGEALDLADEGIARPMGPPTSLVAKQEPEARVEPVQAQAPPSDWIQRQQAALAEKEASLVHADATTTDFEDTPL